MQNRRVGIGNILLFYDKFNARTIAGVRTMVSNFCDISVTDYEGGVRGVSFYCEILPPPPLFRVSFNNKSRRARE